MTPTQVRPPECRLRVFAADKPGKCCGVVLHARTLHRVARAFAGPECAFAERSRSVAVSLKRVKFQPDQSAPSRYAPLQPTMAAPLFDFLESGVDRHAKRLRTWLKPVVEVLAANGIDCPED